MTEQFSRRDFLKLAGLGAATTTILTGCGQATRNFPPLTPASEQSTPEFTATPDLPPTTIPEIVEAITEGLWQKTLESRTELWNSDLGAKLYKLSHYQDLPTDPIEQSIMLEPLINQRVIHVFLGGFDGQDTRTKDWGQMNCDAPISIFFNLDTGQSTVIPWDRDMPLGRGKDHTSDGDVFLRLAHIQSSEKEKSKHLVLDATTPEENITNNLTILTGTPPDYMVNMNMDGLRMIIDGISLIYGQGEEGSVNPEGTLKEIRTRSDKDAGERGLVAVKGAIKLAKILLKDGHSLSSILQAGNLGIEATKLSGDTMLGKNGNPFSEIKSALDKLGLTDKIQSDLANALMDNIIYLRFSLSKHEPEKANSFYYSQETLQQELNAQLGKIRDMGNPDDHDFPILYRDDARSGHNLACPIELFREGGKFVYNQKLNEGVATRTVDPNTGNPLPVSEYNYETVLDDPNELLKLRRYFSVIRHVMARYIEPPFSLSHFINLSAYRLLKAS